VKEEPRVVVAARWFEEELKVAAGEAKEEPRVVVAGR